MRDASARRNRMPRRDPATRLWLVGLMAIAAGLAGCAPPAPLRAEQAWLRTAEPGGVTAGYLMLVNDSAAPVELIGVTSDVANEIQMHETVREGAEVSMRRVERLEVAAHSRLEFRPGGNHLMLMGVRRHLAAGNNAELTLQFADGRRIAALAKVRE